MGMGTSWSSCRAAVISSIYINGSTRWTDKSSLCMLTQYYSLWERWVGICRNIQGIGKHKLRNKEKIIYNKKYQTLSTKKSSFNFLTYKLFSEHYVNTGRRGCAVGKISAFQPQGPQVRSPALPRFELVCATLFPAYANSAFNPSGVGKWVPASTGS